MYEVIYDRDFENDFGDTNDENDVSSWEAIKAELLSKVLFIDRKDGGKRTFTYGHTKDGYANWTLGDDESIVAAYVMYDYANNAARVFFDSYAGITLTDEVPYDITVKIAGADDVTVTAVYASNVLKNETVVTIDFGGKYLSGITVVADGAQNLVASATGVTYTVADATYSALPTITANAVLTKVAADQISVKEYQNYRTDRVTPAVVAKTVDGVYHAENKLDSGDAALEFASFANNAYDANLKNVGGQGKEGALYYGYIAYELEEALTLKAFRLCANDYSNGASYGKYDFTYQGVVIFVSNDGENWTKVGEAYDMVDDGLYVDIPDAIRDYYAADIALNNTAAVKYVAFAIPGAEGEFNKNVDRETYGLCKFSSHQYSHILEVEFYH
jgi:hypothetical protein